MDDAFWDRGRAFLETRMRDTCRITRPGAGAPVLNEETLAYDNPAPVVVYEGKCRIPRRDAGSANAADSGEAEWQVGEYPIALPVESTDYVDGEEVAVGCTVTYLTAARDADLVDRIFGITGLSHQTDATERRFRMMEVVGT